MSENHLLVFEPAPCPVCGATTEAEAETLCRQSRDITDEYYCPGNGENPVSADGRLQGPTPASLAAMDAWIDEQMRENAP